MKQLKHLKKFNEGITGDRVNSYIRIERNGDKKYSFILINDDDTTSGEEITLTYKQREDIEKLLNSNVASIKEGMDVDYIAAKGAIDELLEILSNQEHGERSEIADDIIEFVEQIKAKYKI